MNIYKLILRAPLYVFRHIHAYSQYQHCFFPLLSSAEKGVDIVDPWAALGGSRPWPCHKST